MSDLCAGTRGAVVCATVFACIALAACGGSLPRNLASTGGDAFTFFPETPEVVPVSCHGRRDARFECFTNELDQRLGQSDVNGALIVVERGEEPLVYLRTGDAALTTPETRFPIASVSKMFLGLATMVLADRGVVDLHAPIARVLPELSSERGVGRASLHQLLTHTSGVAIVPSCSRADSDIEDVVRAHGTVPLWTEPGLVYNYANVGYTFAAAVLERATGKPFEAVVAETVLVPANIPDASYDPQALRIEGHRPPGVPAQLRCRAGRPAGGLMMSAAELARWLAVLVAPDPPIDRHVLEAFSQGRAATGNGLSPTYGYGVSHIPHDGVLFFAHNGGHPGFSAFLAWEPSRGFGVAAVADIRGGVAAAASMRAASTFLELSPDWAPRAAPARPIAAYVGAYEDRRGGLGRVCVGLEEDGLVLDYARGMPELLPAEVRFAFVPEDAARATHLVTVVGVAERAAPRCE